MSLISCPETSSVLLLPWARKPTSSNYMWRASITLPICTLLLGILSFLNLWNTPNLYFFKKKLNLVLFIFHHHFLIITSPRTGWRPHKKLQQTHHTTANPPLCLQGTNCQQVLPSPSKAHLSANPSSTHSFGTLLSPLHDYVQNQLHEGISTPTDPFSGPWTGNASSAARRQVLGRLQVTNSESAWVGGHTAAINTLSALYYPLGGREAPSSRAQKDYLEMLLLDLHFFFVGNRASLVSWVANVVTFTIFKCILSI